MDKVSETPKKPLFDACPHCGQKLSPWQQVLLSVDRALMCRNCWYRITLDAFTGEEDNKKPESQKPPSKQ